MSKRPISKRTERHGRATSCIAAAALIAVPALFGLHVDAVSASAQTVCGKRTQVLTDLAQHNGEEPKAIGLSASGTLIEVLVAPNGEWTILMTFPSDQTCLVATGAHWMSIPIMAEGPAA